MTTSEILTGARTLWELVDRRAKASPDHLMLIAEDGETLTFGEFRHRAERVAAGLQDMGLSAGSVVSWQLPTRIDTVVLSLALSRLGAVQNPIIHLYREREVGFALRQTGAELFVIPATWRDTDFAAIAERALAGAPRRPAILGIDAGLPEGDPAGLPEPPRGTAPEDAPIRWIYYTSGSTADPKGVQHTDQTLIAGGWGLARALDMGPDDVGSIAFPFAHIAGPDYLVTMLVHGVPGHPRRSLLRAGRPPRVPRATAPPWWEGAPPSTWPISPSSARRRRTRSFRPSVSCPGAAPPSPRRSTTRSATRSAGAVWCTATA